VAIIYIKKEDNMIRHRNNYSGFLRGFLIGGVAASTLSLLFAPKSGKRLRRDITKKSTKLMHDAESRLDSIENNAEKLIEDTEKRFKKVQKDTESIIDELKHRAVNLKDAFNSGMSSFRN
jgi:gas vesicle protein